MAAMAAIVGEVCGSSAAETALMPKSTNGWRFKKRVQAREREMDSSVVAERDAVR
jgi:hypothetical protein